MLNSATVTKTTRWSRFFNSANASRPNRSLHVRFSTDGGIFSGGRKNVNTATRSQTTAPLQPASSDASAFSALTSQQPAIQPSVPIARTGPNSFLASSTRANTIVEQMLHIGAAQRE